MDTVNTQAQSDTSTGPQNPPDLEGLTFSALERFKTLPFDGEK